MPSSAGHVSTPCDPPLAELDMMEMHEVGSELIAEMTALIFKDGEEKWGEEGSPYRRFYAAAASAPKGRVVVWDTKLSFAPQHLFFRSMDTGRLLAMDNAPFRMQVWQHKNTAFKPKDHQIFTISMMHELLLMRNLHDLGCADIPLIVCNLNREEMEAALDYWVWLSQKGNTTHPDRDAKFQAVFSLCQRTRRVPCFYQLDLVVRKILATPLNNGFVPPFIVFDPVRSREKEGEKAKARVLFTRACAVPPKHLMDLWPNTCGGIKCDDPDCEMIRMPRGGTKAWVLNTDGELVTDKNLRGHKIQSEHYCNHWPCKIKRTPNNDLFRCTRCKGVVYCSAEHQRSDWHLHKAICGSSPRDDTGFQIPKQMLFFLDDGSVRHFDSQFDWYDAKGPQVNLVPPP